VHFLVHQAPIDSRVAHVSDQTEADDAVILEVDLVQDGIPPHAQFFALHSAHRHEEVSGA
jgi:hypothetical protein